MYIQPREACTARGFVAVCVWYIRACGSQSSVLLFNPSLASNNLRPHGMSPYSTFVYRVYVSSLCSAGETGATAALRDWMRLLIAFRRKCVGALYPGDTYCCTCHVQGAVCEQMSAGVTWSCSRLTFFHDVSPVYLTEPEQKYAPAVLPFSRHSTLLSYVQTSNHLLNCVGRVHLAYDFHFAPSRLLCVLVLLFQ